MVFVKPLVYLIFGAIAGTILVVFLFRGIGQDREGWLFTLDKPRLAQSYFKTPEAAVRRINHLQAEEDWWHLAQYFDWSGFAVDVEALQHGTHFINPDLSAEDPERYLRPFPHGARMFSARQTPLPDLFEITVFFEPLNKNYIFYLKRSPDGYQVLAVEPKFEEEVLPGSEFG